MVPLLRIPQIRATDNGCLYGPERWYTGVRRDGIRLDLLRIIDQKVDLGNPLFEEKHIEDTIHFCRPNGYLRNPKGFTHTKDPGVEMDSSMDIRFA